MSGNTNVFNPPIELESYISLPPSDVFKAITTAETWDKWFTTGMELDLSIGGKMLFRWKNWGPHQYEGEDIGEIVEISEPSVFKFQWHKDANIPPTTVAFELKSLGGGTHLLLTETGYLDDELGRGWMLSCATGWGEAIALLKMYLEHGVAYTRRT